MNYSRLVVVAASVLLFGTAVIAEQRPRSTEELRVESDIILCGTVSQFTIESEKSDDGGIWAIVVRVEVEDIEKGHFEESEIEARCFRVKKAVIGLNGHRPIPKVGTRVRCYLKEGNSSGRDTKQALLPEIVYPNGISSLDGLALEDAPEIAKLTVGYTHPFEREFWILLALFGVLVLVVIRVLAWFLRKRTLSRRTETI